MLEANARKIHRTVGIYLVGFLVLQLVSGAVISWWSLTDAPRNNVWFNALSILHHDWNPVGSVYRVLLGVLATGQALGGLAIYLLMRARRQKAGTAAPGGGERH
jgi:hypothetical protein